MVSSEVLDENAVRKPEPKSCDQPIAVEVPCVFRNGAPVEARMVRSFPNCGPACERLALAGLHNLAQQAMRVAVPQLLRTRRAKPLDAWS